jgi:hypothetical protein
MSNYPQKILDYIRDGQNAGFGSPKLNPQVIERLKSINIECDGYHGYLPLKEEGKYLNIGCGYDHRKGYINIDINQGMKPDIIASALDIDTLFESNSITGIVMIHCFQTLYFWEALDFLKKSLYILEPGGRLLLQQQNFGRIMKAMHNHPTLNGSEYMNVINGLYGVDMTLEGHKLIYPTTKFGWLLEFLISQLSIIGFVHIDAVDVEPEDWKPAWKDVIIVGEKKNG